MKVKKFHPLLILLLLIPSITSLATNFYTAKPIPTFTSAEQLVLDEFDINFVQLEKPSQFKKHNSEVHQLIEKHGDDWKEKLNTLASSFGEQNREFIRYLFGNQSLDSIMGSDDRKVSRSLSYHPNGMIAEYKTQKPLRKNGKGLYHFRVKTKNWNQKGQRIKGTKQTLLGST